MDGEVLASPHCGRGSETPGCYTNRVPSQHSGFSRLRGKKWGGLAAAQIGTRRSFNAGIYLPAATTSSKPPVTVRLTCKLPAASRRSGPLFIILCFLREQCQQTSTGTYHVDAATASQLCSTLNLNFAT
ncbi:hypothetical protein PpBr36_07498 [Pyricularia pennisetigena]|uniref:hypothetical protein n=1 Tax=Pyricularia pennisetigena TaxID=1578925 RepID=UPI0011519611|nr:hypothetical protein PpBr36_07498 [Pyricularia pennisetigena]TLS26019.1 hypothetical protein PpBr36_07498 [Pyricularia pennisetigena]